MGLLGLDGLSLTELLVSRSSVQECPCAANQALKMANGR